MMTRWLPTHHTSIALGQRALEVWRLIMTDIDRNIPQNYLMSCSTLDRIAFST